MINYAELFAVMNLLYFQMRVKIDLNALKRHIRIMYKMACA